MTAIIAFLVLVITLIIGVPIPLTFFAASLTIIILGGYNYVALLSYGFNSSSSIILIAIPLFILAGSVMEKSGISESLVNFVDLFVGRVKGGLNAVMVLSCAAFSAISGSGFATLSCVGSIMLPKMYKNGYPKGVSSALISSASLLGVLFPPSLTKLMFAFVSGQSVLAAFVATVIPGIILIILLSATSMWLVRKDPNIRVDKRMTRQEFAPELKKRTVNATPALLAPIIILGGIYGGFLTPTEAAAVSVVYSVPIGWWIYKGLNTKTMKECLISAGTTTGVVMIMLFSVMVLSQLFTRENVPQMILNAMTAVSDNPIIIVLMINLFLIAVGMFMDDISAILLTTPIILPIAIAIGIHPIHYAAIMSVNLSMGCVMPPTAPFLYLGSRIGGAPINEMLRPTMWLILFAWIPTLLLTTFIPEMSLIVPRVLGLI